MPKFRNLDLRNRDSILRVGFISAVAQTAKPAKSQQGEPSEHKRFLWGVWNFLARPFASLPAGKLSWFYCKNNQGSFLAGFFSVKFRYFSKKIPVTFDPNQRYWYTHQNIPVLSSCYIPFRYKKECQKHAQDDDPACSKHRHEEVKPRSILLIPKERIFLVKFSQARKRHANGTLLTSVKIEIYVSQYPHFCK